MSDEKPIDRRRFFREGLRGLLKPVAKAVDPIERVARQLKRIHEEHAEPPPAVLERDPVEGAVSRTMGGGAAASLEAWHRPPGALPEARFLDTCSRCGECVRVCPAHCIKIDASGAKGAGAPYIEPNEMPCVLCDGLRCMPACPTGALVPTLLADIDMGTAVWREEICLRTRGVECTICVDSCPVGTVALELRGNAIHVNEAGCTGCGVCQHRCPTKPKSIVVIQRDAQMTDPLSPVLGGEG